MDNLLSIHQQLKRIMGDSGFSGQIIKIRRPHKRIPDWTRDNKKVQEVLLRSFPDMEWNDDQRFRAGRWACIINLYFRQNWTRGQIAEELNMTYERVKAALQRIRRAGAERRTDNKGKLGKPKGRPPRRSLRA